MKYVEGQFVALKGCVDGLYLDGNFGIIDQIMTFGGGPGTKSNTEYNIRLNHKEIGKIRWWVREENLCLPNYSQSQYRNKIKRRKK